MFKKRINLIGRATCLIGLSLVPSVSSIAHEGATGVVKDRMDRFKESKDIMKQLKTRLDDPAKASELANRLLDWAQVMPDYFPVDSNPPPSEALDRIWDEFAAFEQAARDYQEATQAFIDVASQNASGELPTAYRAIGQACKDCHNRYKD